MKEFKIRQTLDAICGYLTELSPLPSPLDPEVKRTLYTICTATPSCASLHNLEEDKMIRPLKLEIAQKLCPTVSMEEIEEHLYYCRIWYAKEAVQELIEKKGCQNFCVEDEYEDIAAALKNGAPVYGVRYFNYGREFCLYQIMYSLEACAWHGIDTRYLKTDLTMH